MTDLHLLTIADASAAIERGEIRPSQLTDAILERVDDTEPRINAYVTITNADARREAEAADQRQLAGKRLGPLDGIPIGVKDLYDTAQVVTTGGTGAYRYRVPDRDAAAVTRLREAGAVMIGKTNTHELAYGGTTNNIHYGATHNPWALDRTAGGSSGGSAAAVAVGAALGALGTDTGGSIRIPAAYCGVTGHKPTYGLVSRAGILPLSQTLDHAGPIARTAHDCALMLDVLQGFDQADEDSVEHDRLDLLSAIEDTPQGVRLAVIPSMLWNTLPAVRRNFERSLEELRALGVEVTTVEPMAGQGDWRNRVIHLMAVEAYANWKHLLDRRVSQIGPSVEQRLRIGQGIGAEVYARELGERKRIEQAFERPIREGRIHGYVLPTSPIVAFDMDGDPTIDTSPVTIFQNTTVFDLTHQPSISVPNGTDFDDLPTGLMITTGLWQDALALRIAHAYQRSTEYHTARPTLE